MHSITPINSMADLVAMVTLMMRFALHGGPDTGTTLRCQGRGINKLGGTSTSKDDLVGTCSEVDHGRVQSGYRGRTHNLIMN